MRECVSDDRYMTHYYTRYAVRGTTNEFPLKSSYTVRPCHLMFSWFRHFRPKSNNIVFLYVSLDFARKLNYKINR